MKAKQIMFWLWTVLLILGFIGEATTLQLAPVVGIVFILAAEIWAEKKLFVAAMVLSIIMATINFYVLSWIDVAFWIATIVVFTKNQK